MQRNELQSVAQLSTALPAQISIVSQLGSLQQRQLQKRYDNLGVIGRPGSVCSQQRQVRFHAGQSGRPLTRVEQRACMQTGQFHAQRVQSCRGNAIYLQCREAAHKIA
jgi:hypothetical protein